MAHVDGRRPKAETKAAAASAEFSAAALAPTFPKPPTRNPFGGPLRDLVVAAQPGKTGKKIDDLFAKTIGKKGNIGKVDGMVLNATCVVGDQEMAMIDGHLYAEQDLIPAPAGGGPQYKILSVLPYKVLLERGGRTLELTYSNAAASPTTGGNATSDVATPSKGKGKKSGGSKGGSKGSSTKKS